jgi:hypothetical protein
MKTNKAEDGGHRTEDEPGTKILEGTAAEDAAPAAGAAPRKQEASNRPVWTRQIGRVEASVWENLRNGEVVHSISIFRSFVDRKSGEKKRHHS